MAAHHSGAIEKQTMAKVRWTIELSDPMLETLHFSVALDHRHSGSGSQTSHVDSTKVRAPGNHHQT
jgi:hypothetical protein